MREIKIKIKNRIEKELDINIDINNIERPEPKHGDFAYPAMKAASQLNKNPMKIAEKLSKKLKKIDIIEKIKIVEPGYVNIYLNKEKYLKKISKKFKDEKLGIKTKEGKVLVEFSSPNLAKPMHIGHLRNNALGDSLQKILSYVGYNVISENYIGDWGTKHGEVIYAYKKWGSEEKFQKKPMEHMYELYVKLNQEADEETRKKARKWSKKIEEGDKEAVKLWEKFREETIKYDKKEYERMKIEFDRWTGESKVADQTKKIIDEGIEKNIFKEDDDGSIYVEFEELPDTIVKRKDGSTLYLSRDLANLKKRSKEGFDLNLYIVGSEQELHFKQLFKLAEKFDITNIKNEHVSYGLLQLKDESMSSRKGNIIQLSQVLDKAEEKAKEKIREKNIENAEKISLGAIKYANLSVSRNKDIEFDWDQILDFKGDSGPYIQYSNTRAKSIIEKTDEKGKIKPKIDKEEYLLARKISEFPDKIEEAAEEREPAKIANYLSNLCERFNKFYHQCPVLDAPEKKRKTRIKLVELFIQTSDQGLQLLGIPTLREM